MNIAKYLQNKYPVANNSDIEDKIQEEFTYWEKSIHRKLQVENPFYDNQLELERAKKDYISQSINLQSLMKDYKNYSLLPSIYPSAPINIEKKFWIDEINKIKNISKTKRPNSKQKKEGDKKNQKEIKITRKLLLQKWEEDLSKAYQQWEFEEIEKYRRQFLEKLEEWLKLLQQFQDLMNDLSLDTGLLFDLSKGGLTQQDINQLKKWADLISRNKGVRELCDMLGRLRQVEKSTKQEIVKTTIHLEQEVKDYSSKEEIVGIKISNELEHILPQELAILGDPEISILFDKKFVEGELMCFDLEGIKKEHYEEEIEEVKEISEDDKMGPIILCVDTSGSMSGSPETIAKAISLYIATRAIKQNRDCYLINFSTSIETLDLSGKMGIKDLITFLSKSFHGGTDVAPALVKALDKIKKEKYSKSDVLVISDFVMSSLPNQLVESIQTSKKNKNSFYSLAIGNLFLGEYLERVFNKQWVYNPNNSSVTQIRNITNEILQ